VGIDDFPPLRVSLAELAARPGRFYGLAEAGRLVGAIEVEELRSKARQISALVVEPECARRGLGRRLVNFVLEDAPESVTVWTSVANQPALALYRSVGFRHTATFSSAEGVTLCSLEWVRGRTPESLEQTSSAGSAPRGQR